MTNEILNQVLLNFILLIGYDKENSIIFLIFKIKVDKYHNKRIGIINEQYFV